MQETNIFIQLMNIFKNMYVVDLMRYVIGAGGVYLIINILLARTLEQRKIRTTMPSAGQIKREILASMRTVIVFALNGTLVVFGAQQGVLEIYLDIEAYGITWLIVSTVILIVAHDAWFFWTHKALHYPPLFRRFHRLHHKSHNPTPFSSYAFDAGEAVSNAVYLPLILILMPVHPIALFVFVTHMMLRNAIGHCGYEIFPSNRHGKPLFDWMTTVTHHDMHHAHAGYNIGLYFTWWDRWMGTEHPEYHANFKRASSGHTQQAHHV